MSDELFDKFNEPIEVRLFGTPQAKTTMTISQLVIQSPTRSSEPPESIFQAQDENGKRHLFCMASFGFQPEVDHLCKIMPGCLNWEVIQPHMTQEEIDEFIKRGDK